MIKLWIVNKKVYGLVSKAFKAMAKKSRNMNHSNNFNIKFMPRLSCCFKGTVKSCTHAIMNNIYC